VLLRDCCESEVEEVATRLVNAVDGSPPVSIGVATWAGEAGDVLVARADRAMYEAKAAGGARIVIAEAPAAGELVADTSGAEARPR
jgi:GGDEF domain-containing protein